MNISLVFYLISVLGSVSVFLSALTIAMSLIAIVLTFAFVLKYSDSDISERYLKSFLGYKEFFSKHLKSYVVTFVSIVFVNCLIPSTLTMYSLVGVNYLSDSKIPEKVVKLVNMKLDEYIEKQIKKESK